MFDFLTGIVLLLSGIYEGSRLAAAFGSLAEIDEKLSAAGLSSEMLSHFQSTRSDIIFEIIVCAVLIALTAICLFRFIRYVIIGNIILFTATKTSDFMKTTNSGRK